LSAVLDRVADPSYDLLTDLEELEDRCRAIAEAKLPFGYDYETGYYGESREGAALHPEENFIVSVQLTNDLSWSRMVPLAFEAGENVDNAKVAALLWPLFHVVDDEGLPLAVAHGAQAERRWGARFFLKNLWNHPLFGRQVRESHGYHPIRSDTMLEAYCEGEHQSNALKQLTLVDFGHKMRELADLQTALLGRPPTDFEKNSVRFSVFNMRDPEVIAYACEDAVETLRHHLMRFPKMRRSFIYKAEMAALPVVCDMADAGVQYDWRLLAEKNAEVKYFAELLLVEVIEDFEALAGVKLPPSFNFNSTDQLADLLYNKCGMPVLHTTDAGKPSTDAKKALPGLALIYPEIRKYQGWKRLHDLQLKFLAIYENKYSWAADGRAHPLLKQNGTITGRFSCEAPNYQQSPGKYHFELRDGTTFDFNFRDAIVAAGPGWQPWWDLVLEEAGCADLAKPEELGWYIVGFDLSQVELRALAAEAGETALLEAFKRGEDVHRLTAALMLGKPPGEVTKEERQDKGKRMNFAIGYGLTPPGMSQQTGKPIEECRELFDQYLGVYTHLKAYSKAVIRQARRDGHVITKFGRKVTIFEFQDPSPRVQASGERTAGNCTIQGPATGDYMKVAMVRAVRALKKAGLDDRVRMIMNIHDALEFEVREDVTPLQVIEVLQDAVIFPVKGPGVEWPPLVADWHTGPSWGQLKEIHVCADGTVQPGKPDDCEVCTPPPAPVAAEPEPEPAVVMPAEIAGPPRDVIVALSAMPLRSEVSALRDFMKSLPGANRVELRVPDGDSERVIAVPFACGLAPEHEARVSIIVGAPAAVLFALGSITADDIASGLDA
jgi:DNA polymerase I-like protein with 3'-5' exonuclease and polymerase domains